MWEISIPKANLQLRQEVEGAVSVFDPLRRKWVVLTPEEWVRQHFTAWLANDFGYPRALMANEVGLSLNGTKRRCDTVIYMPQGTKPLAIVEYKAPHIPITQKVFDQIMRYNIVMKVPCLLISNGRQVFGLLNSPDGDVKFLNQIPDYKQLKEYATAKFYTL